jgi:hypothetical protein
MDEKERWMLPGASLLLLREARSRGISMNMCRRA